MKTYDKIDLILTNAPIIIILLAATSQMIVDGSIFTYIKVGPIAFHALTTIALGFAFLIGCDRLRFLTIPTRQIYSAALVVTGIHVYDVIWSIGSIGVRGFPFSWLSLISLFVSFLLLIILEKQEPFIQNTDEARIIMLVFFISMVGLVLSGFFQKMALYELGLGPDPNVGNYWWILSKFSGLLIFPFSTMKGEEAEEIRMPFYDAI